MKLLIQLVLYCLLFTGMVKYSVLGGALDGLYFYPKPVQERAIEIGLTTRETIAKKRRNFMILFYLVMLTALLLIIGLWNRVDSFKTAYAIIGSSDFDQDGKFSAWLKTKLILKLMYPVLKTGTMPEWMISVMKKRHSAEELQNSERMISAISSGMKHVTKNSVRNQFYSDLITLIDKNIRCSGTEIHIFYALQMGEKYRLRYLLHFAEPDIIEQNYGHEELLFFHPEQWVKAVCDCCQYKLY